MLRNVVSLAAAVGVTGVSFGVLSTASGFSVAQTCVLSLVAFTGASQFLYVSVLGAGGALAAALGPALLLAGRNAVYGLSLDGVLSRRRLRRALEAHFVIDETTAMSHAQPEPAARRRAYLLTAAFLYLLWNAGTLAGAVAGRGIGDPRRYGLDALFPAVFLALLAPQLRRPRAAATALAGAAIAFVLLPWVPVGLPVLAAAGAALLGLRR